MRICQGVRREDSDSIPYVTFFVLDNGDYAKERIRVIAMDTIVGNGNNGKFINDSEITGEIKLTKPNYPYKIVAVVFNAG